MQQVKPKPWSRFSNYFLMITVPHRKVGREENAYKLENITLNDIWKESLNIIQITFSFLLMFSVPIVIKQASKQTKMFIPILLYFPD